MSYNIYDILYDIYIYTVSSEQAIFYQKWKKRGKKKIWRKAKSEH